MNGPLYYVVRSTVVQIWGIIIYYYKSAHLTVSTRCLRVAPAPAAGVGAGVAVDGGGGGELGEGEEGAVQAESPAQREAIG